MLIDTLSIRVTLACLVLSMLVTLAYIVRISYRHDVRYDATSEWFGHGLHGIGMTYMSLVMLGWTPVFVPFAYCAVFFTFCTAVFVVRIIFRLYHIWWWDWLHVVGSASMAYMFFNLDMWSPIYTFAFISYYLLVIGIYVYYVIEHAKTKNPRARFAQQLSNVGHHAMAVAMILMLLIMQFPVETARLSGIVCGDSATQAVSGHHHH